ncbi:hypothetical protein PybrP1_008122 [[Pythium] brassicae (nom. inval.)]|nr:hypothetical protein PybrP1_008122 [[Pythium] brassicae (nom. inval.)]
MDPPAPSTTSAAEDDAALLSASHLLVLQHGLHGSEHDFANFVRLVREHLAAEGVYVHAAARNAATFFQTYDGIDQGGERLADEIEALAARMPHLRKLSLLGHSLGGLYARYCIGVLLARGFFARVEPMNFITMATPHLGIRRPQRGSVNFMYNSITKKLFHRANELTHALSMNAVASQPEGNMPVEGAHMEREGTLLICLDSAVDDGELYEYYFCVLSDQILRLYEIETHSAVRTPSAAESLRCLVEIDLMRADVTLTVPHRPVAARAKTTKRSSSGGLNGLLYSGLLSLARRSRSNSARSDSSLQSAASELSDPDLDSVSYDPYEVTIRWRSLALSDLGRQRKCVIRIPAEEMDRDWKWLVALSNNAYGMRCQTKQRQKDAAAREEIEGVDAPPLLCCLARGQFVQALLMFKTRTAYANVFFDLQVPYSCASVRAFNPYRMETAKRSTSPVYPHITHYSVGSAPLLRDTLSAEIRVQLSSKRGTVRFFSQDGHRKRLSLTGGLGGGADSSQRASAFDADDSDDNMADNRYTATDETEFSRRSFAPPPPLASTLSRSTGSSASFSGDGSRSDPFVDGEVIVDRVHEAFSSDSERDALRGMLVTLQSVGWRRVDVMFDNVLAHERIIAKRANPAKMSESGIDLVYHVMNTLVL